MAKPIRALELHYPIIQFLIINLIYCFILCGCVKWTISTKLWKACPVIVDVTIIFLTCTGVVLNTYRCSFLLSLLQWTKRFFVLHKNKLLYYYKSDKDRKPVKDPIQLTWCKCVESNLDHEKFKYLFSIVTDKRTYYLVAETQQDMDIWVEKLCIVCGFIRTDHGTMDQGQSLGEVLIYSIYSNDHHTWISTTFWRKKVINKYCLIKHHGPDIVKIKDT